MKLLKLTEIIIDAGTQVRVELDQATVLEYKEALADKVNMPPLDVFVDGKKRYLADGFHRHAGAVALGLTEINCTLHKGTLDDAIKFALGANYAHGLRRRNVDKLNAISIAFTKFGDLSDRAIAEMCKVSNVFVGNHRPAPATPPPEPEIPPAGDAPAAADKPSGPPAPRSAPPPPKRKGRDGVERSMPKKLKKLDKTGYLIPDELAESWDAAEENKAVVSQLRTIRGMAENQSKKTEFCEVDVQTLIASLEQAQANWEQAIPYAVCPTCVGKAARSKCGMCKTRGFVSHFYWKQCVPEEMQKIRVVAAEAEGKKD